MPASMTNNMQTKHPRRFENQTGNRPPNRVNSILHIVEVLEQLMFGGIDGHIVKLKNFLTRTHQKI